MWSIPDVRFRTPGCLRYVTVAANRQHAAKDCPPFAHSRTFHFGEALPAKVEDHPGFSFGKDWRNELTFFPILQVWR
jgi:hypothetical protein